MNLDSNNNIAEGHSQPWLLSSALRLPTNESVGSKESLVSQVPLPYHLPADHPDHEYTSRPLIDQAWTHQRYPDQPPVAFRNPPTNQSDSFHGQQFGIPPGHNVPAMPSTSYDGYHRFDQQASYTSDYSNQYRSGYPQMQSNFGNHVYQHSSHRYAHNVETYGHNGWQNASEGPQLGLPYQQEFAPVMQPIGDVHGPDRTLSPLSFYAHEAPNPAAYPVSYGSNEDNRNYKSGKPLTRRNTHGSHSSVASSNPRGQHNNNNRQNNGACAPRRYVSAGGDRSRHNNNSNRNPYFEQNTDLTTSPIKTGGHGQFEPAQDISEPSPWTTQAYQTPKGKLLEARPTPKTARELGQETPTPFLRSRRNESVTDAARSFKPESMKEPPPSFWLSSRRRSTTESGKVSPCTVPEGRIGRSSDAPDPFFAESTDIATHNRSTRVSFGTPSRMVVPLHVARYQPAPGPSAHLAALCPDGQKPTVEVAFDAANMPFVEPARTHPSQRHTGVVRISNIPFSCSQQEILAFLGRNAKLIPEIDEPIHIVMERVTSKTMDAFVEFININEAVNAVTRYEANRAGGRGGRLGERHVSLEVCGHELFMQALFPKAVNIIWRGADPQILTNQDRYNSGFKGFISREELVMLVKHVEAPQRSPFSNECPQRPFECLISSVAKYPWHKVQDITIGDRDALFQTATALCRNLVERIETGGQDLLLNDRLLKRVQRAVLNCSGFSESQKDDFAFIFKMTSIEAGLPPHADHWSVFKTIGAKRNWHHDVILYYIALLREATTSSALVSLAERSAKGHQTSPLSAFGNIEIEYPKDVSNMSLSSVGEIEWHAIEALLRKVLE